MFVITADQVASRTRPDIASSERDRLETLHGGTLLLPVARNAGDEIQLITADAASALRIVLELTRNGAWSVGLGCGEVNRPLPDDVREASGPAFFAARDAVERAKKASPRFAVGTDRTDSEDPAVSAADAEALVALVIVLRERRSIAGWEVYDRVVAGALQTEIADELGVSAPAISARVRAANIRAEQDALPALARLLERLDRANEGAA